jgi:IS30 family transposase
MHQKIGKISCNRKAVHLSNLTLYEREFIESCLRPERKLRIRTIAKLLGRDHSVVSREIRRNNGHLGYVARLAQEAANRRAQKTNKRKLDKDYLLLEYVQDQLFEGWSPEQIAGRLRKHPPPHLRGKYISHEQIYQYIYEDGRDSQGRSLFRYLRRKKPFRQPKHSRKANKITIKERVSILERPEDIGKKLTFGHWESDTILDRYRKGLSVQYMRKSQMVKLHKLQNLKAEATREAITESLIDLPEYLRQSMTFDNGMENAEHYLLRDGLEIGTYFCEPYKSWQKGGVENMNGLLREYLPKKVDLNKITENEINIIQEKLNNRPRKSLNFLTPNEIIKNEILVH